MPGLLAQLQAEGYDPYCFQSVLINGEGLKIFTNEDSANILKGKGRVHCRPKEILQINGKDVDSHGCVKQPSGAVAYGECKPSESEYKVLTVLNAERVTVMVKLDQEPKDYAIRFYALSDLQSLQGYAILRYPHRRFNQPLGVPVPQPGQEDSSMHLDGSPKSGVKLEDKILLPPFPESAPPQKADITLRFKATGAPDPNNPYITNCSLNGVPWQIFRALMEPLVLDPKREMPGPNPAVKNLPLGSVVDIIVENDLPVSLPMYKHNDPTYLLGKGDTKFEWKDVAEANAKQPKSINLDNPPLGYLHELPASGWMALRWKITQSAMTMFHVFRVRYFVLGMQVPLYEGDDAWPDVPGWVGKRPHVEFDKIPGHGGIFD
ncbi:hypothetical protein N0V90_004027 [Kalmusia sp. IMI 367209]|nr:hypothetical protein N0V90_004027 [Kalmusia sp. IMI 367209]